MSFASSKSLENDLITKDLGIIRTKADSILISVLLRCTAENFNSDAAMCSGFVALQVQHTPITWKKNKTETLQAWLL